MANTINVNIAASDNGSVGKITNEAKKLNSELEKAKRNAASIRPASQTAAMSSTNDLTDVGANRLAKGISGATGAAGRDFAKQAQGLGGLVHVYATFAANLFAVTAGFQALSKAADYTNMIKGLDQLGAASGKNLGTMAKNVAALTDGAVSLKEAMGAVAQASSAGMSGDQIERMALVAKKASQALGRDMGDSLNRISRGITKLEPELLDEIGIFIRVDKAASDYALSIGKTANSLTDFEKRQAFANAALKQAEDKFGKINLDANPFSKLQASFIDLLYKGGELINKVLGPIASLLASAPVALGTAMAGIVGILLKQAIPAMTQWRSGLLEAADAAEKVAKRTAEAHQQYKIGKEIEAGKAVLAPMEAQMTSSINSIQKKLQEALPKSSKLLANAVSDSFDPEKEASKYTTAYKRIQKEAEILEKAKTKMSQEQAALADKELAKKQESIKLLKEAQREAINLAGVQKAYLAEQSNLDARSEKAGLYEKMLGSNAARAASKASSARILADVGINTQEMGPIDAFKKMLADIGEAKTDKKLGSIRAGFTAVSGAARIAGAALMTVVSALSNVFMIVGVLTVAFQVLDGVFSTNSKQMEEYSGALEASNEAALGLARTTDYLRDNNLSSAFSTEGVSAFANALEEVSNKLLKVEKNFRALKENEGVWDSFKNAVLDIVNMDVERKAAETYANNIYQVLQSTTDPKQYEDLLNTIKYNIGSDAEGLSKKDLIAGLDKLFNEGRLSKVGAITDKIEEQSKAFKKASGVLQGYKTSVEAASKSMQTLTTSFIPSDAMSKFGIEQMNAAKELAKALEDPASAISALAETVSKFDAMKIFPAELQDQLLQATPQIKALQESLTGYDTALLELKKSRDALLSQKMVEEYDGTEDNGTAAQSGRRTVKAEESVAYKENLRLVSIISEERTKSLAEAAEISKSFAGTAVALFEDGSAKITQALKAELEKAAIGYSKTIASQFKGPEATKVMTDLQIQEISIQQKIIESQMGVVISQERLRVAMEANTIEQALTNARNLGASKEELDKLNRSKTANKSQAEFLEGKSSSQLRKDLAGNTGMAMQFSSLSANIEGAYNQIAALDIQKKGIKLTGAIKAEYDRLEQEKESIANQQKDLDTKTQTVDRKLSYGYTEALSAEKESLSIESDKLKEKEAQASLDTLRLKHTIALNAEQANGGKNYAALKKAASAEESLAENALQKLKQSNVEKLAKYADERNARAREQAQFLFDIEMRKQEAVKATADIMLNMYKSSVDKQVSAGTTSKSGGIKRQAELDLENQRREYAIASAKKQQELDQAKALQATQDSPNNRMKVQALEIEARELDKQNTLKQAQIKLEAEYQAALVKTEETLRSIEKTGVGVSEYGSAMYQDFSNKVADLVKNTKSAASAFNEGFINAIDSSIDKFFDMLQKSELTMKDMVNFARNALSDVFRDTASQVMKNAWKDALSGMLPESDEKKASKALVSALDNLRMAIEGKSGVLSGATTSPGVGGSMYNKADGTSKTAEDIVKEQNAAFDDVGAAAATSKDAAGGFLQSASGMWEAVKSFASGNATFSQTFGRIIEGFGNMMPSLFTGIYSAIAGAMGSMGGGGGGGGGIFGTLLKAGISAFTGGFSTSAVGPVTGGVDWDFQNAADEAWLYSSAKGNAFTSAEGLSRYSNSIVTSPTMFAFAHGGVPNRGLMGESGPEAIIPLKRDATGNLGIRGGGEMVNNIDINISIEGGSEKDNGGGMSKDMAGLLGNSIKAAVTQELIKQSRPGGLLAR